MWFVSNKAFPMLAQPDNLSSYKFQRGFCPSENTVKGSLLYVFKAYAIKKLFEAPGALDIV